MSLVEERGAGVGPVRAPVPRASWLAASHRQWSYRPRASASPPLAMSPLPARPRDQLPEAPTPAGPDADLAADMALVRRALSGDDAALHLLAVRVTPVVQARIARALYRRRGQYTGDPRARLEDLVQETFVELFRDGAKVLRAWDGARGLTLSGFAGLVAEQRVFAFLRHRKATARLEDLDGGDDALARRPDPAAESPESRAAAREELEKVLDGLRAELTPAGRAMFERLVLDEEPIADVARDTGMTVAAVQAWSSRLKRRMAALWGEIAGTPPRPARAPDQEGASR